MEYTRFPPPEVLICQSRQLISIFFLSHRVGDSGLYVSKAILGTASYGSSRWQEWILEEEAALPLLKHAFDVGINTWDTVGRL
ncbi:hypothetical protein BDV24DRAFT_33680 [Aspergillus arachidicola]|uniref:NADP-dependent oxidoreductase domain-containing protein n=1 Tax=Aspergillus arachidicola TaxID=656916 RepID=A0A5N6YCI5_9EURO|nr:hypothetical protein BDV24DRAFT_33680 [Aspergillus arachidicola]